MGLKYPGNATSGYNASAPADDSSITESNKVKWSTIKTKLTDTLKAFGEAIDSDLSTWADLGPITKTAVYTVVAGDHLKTIECNGTFTVTLGATASLTAGFTVTIKNTGTGTITIDGNSSETIDGDLTKAITENEGLTLQVNSTETGWVVLSKLEPQFKTPVTTSGTVTAYTATTGEGAYTTNKVYVVQIHGDNTGAATINFDSLGAKSIKLADGTDPYAGALQANQEARFTYDGTNMVLATVGAALIQTSALEQTAGSEAVTQACMRANSVGTSEIINLSVDGGKFKMTGVTDSTTGSIDSFTFPQGILLYAATNTGSGGVRNSYIQLHNGSTWVDVFSFADTRLGGYFDGAIPSSGSNLRILDDPASGTHNYAYKIITN